MLQAVVEAIPAAVDGSCVRVAVDGPDGAGKTIFADELATAIRDSGRPAIRVSLDDFHNVRAVRYRRGQHSPDGCWLDSYNYDRFIAYVLDPLGPGGPRRYRAAAHDLASDAMLSPTPLTAPPAAVLVVDGLFLHRDELVGYWDFSIFLNVPFVITAARMARRDGTDPDPDHPSQRRYVQAQRSYFAACAPSERASLVIDNSDAGHPRICRRGSARRCFPG